MRAYFFNPFEGGIYDGHFFDVGNQIKKNARKALLRLA